MRPVSAITTAILSAVAVSGAVQAAASGGAAHWDATKAALDKYCTTCHNADDWAGSLALDTLDLSKIGEQPEVGEKIIAKLGAGLMPPYGKPRPARDEALQVVSSLENAIDSTAARKQHHEPPPGVHRLNRREYANAIRDLLDLDIDPATLLPVDDSSNGFDNIAAALGTSPALIEAYITAAGKLSRLALGHELGPVRKEYLAPYDYSQNARLEGAPFGSRGGLVVQHYFPADGEYEFNWAPVRANAGQIFGNTTGEKLELSIDGQLVKVYDIDKDTARGEGDHHEVRAPVKAGMRTVSLTFADLSHLPSDDINQHFQRTTLTQNVPGFTFSAHVNSMSIAGPFKPSIPEHTTSRDRILLCKPAKASQETACARQILATLATEAYRRQVSGKELDVLVDFYKQGRAEGGFETGIERGVQVVLSDPKFIYRTEEVDKPVRGEQAYRLSDVELASRLSFFLWSSVPDEQLRTFARQGKLHGRDMLQRQVKRMLADPRLSEFVTNFAGQWLQLRNLRSAAPVARAFPDFDDNLRDAFRTEAEMFFGSIVREDRNVVDLLDADYTFVNERLARHYGIPGVYGSQFRRVTLGPEQDMRRGLLGKGAVLTVTSVADRTSTVRRGKWVLLNILGVMPPDPPPNVPALDVAPEGDAVPKVVTMRERMQTHATNPSCASCHQMMDPIGFAMESFDGVGAWRRTDNGRELDLSGHLVNGKAFNGPSELRKALLDYSPQFVQTLVVRLMTYALGRGVDAYDMPTVRAIVRDAAKQDNRFSALMLGIVESQQFQMNELPRNGASNITTTTASTH